MSSAQYGGIPAVAFLFHHCRTRIQLCTCTMFIARANFLLVLHKQFIGTLMYVSSVFRLHGRNPTTRLSILPVSVVHKVSKAAEMHAHASPTELCAILGSR